MDLQSISKFMGDDGEKKSGCTPCFTTQTIPLLIKKFLDSICVPVGQMAILPICFGVTASFYTRVKSGMTNTEKRH
jgi:hypothetical protein